MLTRASVPIRGTIKMVDRIFRIWERRCPKSLRLCRLMCGRPLAFRQVSPLEFGLRPVLGAQPRIHYQKPDGSAERFRTSVGIASRVNDFLAKAAARKRRERCDNEAGAP